MGGLVSVHEILSQIQGKINDRLAGWPAEWQGYHWPGYSLEHTYRVRSLALQMGKVEGANPFILDAAALLHDVAKPLGEDHAAVGAREAEGILGGLGVGPEECRAICSAIKTHIGLAGPQDPIENRILSDADYIDANFGLIAVWRYITIRGHRRDPLAMQVREMTSWLEKRRGASDRLATRTGREIGAARYDRMVGFCRALGAEHERGETGTNTGLWHVFTRTAERPDIQASLKEVESATARGDGATARTFVSEITAEIQGQL